MALDWLTKGLGKKSKSNHPLATSDSLQEVIDSLPVSNPSRLIGEVGEWIAPAEKTDLSLQTRVDAYTRLDEEAQPFVNELWFGMLATPVADPRAEQAWFALQNYARCVMRSYHDLMRDHAAA